MASASSRLQADVVEFIGWKPMPRSSRSSSSRPSTEVIIVKTILLLTLSNVFMTAAWYGHLKFKNTAIWLVVLVSWGIAFFEYCLQVPANRIGHNEGMSAAKLKILQEVITLAVFCVFSVSYLNEPFKWNYGVAFALVMAAVWFVHGF